MADYIAKCQEMTANGNQMLEFGKTLDQCMDDLNNVKNSFRRGVLFGENLDVLQNVNISKLAKEIESEKQQMEELGNTLIKIAAKYLANEEKIRDNYTGECEISSVVFDGSGSYGADQGSPSDKDNDIEKTQELYDIINKYYPNMTVVQMGHYLQKLNSEGCGYAAIINTIFAAYEGRELEFEKTFGFSMYDETGELNFDKLLVDFYAATDNHSASWFGWGKDSTDNWDDYDIEDDGMPWNYNSQSDTTGSGSTAKERQYRAELYLTNHNADINVNIENDVEVTIDNFSEIIEAGSYVTISFHNGNLYNEDGSIKQYIEGGHAMVVTGVTTDGKFIVSSWGEKYYIDPDEIIKVDGNKTWMEFSVINYDKIEE